MSGAGAARVDSARWWASIDRHSLRADLLAGLLGALLVLPQGVAFARLAGLPAVYGIYTSLVPCIIAALAGSSRHVSSGPTNAISLALFAMIHPLAVASGIDYLHLVLAASLMVGVLQLLVALLRLGVLSSFIAPAVLSGFTAGAACLIAWHALLGVASLAARPDSAMIAEYGVGLLALGATIAAARWRPRWPAMLIGLVAAWGASLALEASGATALAKLGLIERVVPPLSNPLPSLAQASQLIGIALALTLISLAQSISIAKAIAERSGQVIDTNREILGQGLSNLVGPFLSSYLSCGSLNRSMPSYESGARTPLAAVFSALLTLLLVGLAASMIAQIPLVAIEALLLYVAWTLVNLPRLREIAGFSRADAISLGVTWAATMFIRMELALLIGMGLSLMFYLLQSSRPAVHSLVPWGASRRFTPIGEIAGAVRECPQLKLLRMEGAVYFAAVDHVREALRRCRDEAPGQRHLLVMAKSMNFIDQAGDRLWRDELAARRAEGGDLYFHRPRTPVLQAWRRSGMLASLGESNLFATKHDALGRIVERLDPALCADCSARIFDECAHLPGAPEPGSVRADPG